MRLAERVAAGDQRHGFFVVHRHAAEGLADVVSRREGIGVAVRTFGVHVDQSHLHRGQRVLQVAAVDFSIGRVVGDEHRLVLVLFDALGTTGVANVAPQPGGFLAPVHVLIRLPDVLAAPAEPERLETHRFEATLPARIIRSAQEILRPYFCLMGHRSRRALSRLTLSGQLLRGANRCWPRPPPPRPSPVR